MYAQESKNANNHSFFQCVKQDYRVNSKKSFIILLFYRLQHYTHSKKSLVLFCLIISLLKAIAFFLLRVDSQISLEAVIGYDIRLPHSAAGVVISSYAIIEDHQTIFHQVTIGINDRLPKEKRRVVIRNNCYLSAGCKIINCEVGSGSRIGPNAVVYKDLPENTLYVSTNEIIQQKC